MAVSKEYMVEYMVSLQDLRSPKVSFPSLGGIDECQGLITYRTRSRISESPKRKIVE